MRCPLVSRQPRTLPVLTLPLRRLAAPGPLWLHGVPPGAAPMASVRFNGEQKSFAGVVLVAPQGFQMSLLTCLGVGPKKNLAERRQGAAELSHRDLGGLKCRLVRIAEMHHPNSMEVAVHFRLGSRQPLLASSRVLLLFAELVTATKARPVT